MLKVGVVGVGAMGQHHARLYVQMGCELIGVADIDPNRGQHIASRYRTRWFRDYRELIGQVEAVSIAVPTTLHGRIGLDFLRAGVHCLVEKPIAFSLEEADEMIETARSRKVNLAIGHIERFNPAVVKLKHLVDAGVLGKLLIISTRRVGPYVPRMRDVGVIIDSATHDIGVVRYLLGQEPVNVFARSGSLQHLKEDHAIIVLDFQETIASIEVNWFTPHKVRTLTATGSMGIAYLDYIDQTVKVYNSHDMEIENIQKAEPLKLELEDFLDSISNHRQPSVDGMEGRAILQTALKSCQDQRCIAV